MLGRLSTEQRAAGYTAPLGDAGDDLRDALRHELAARDVIEKEQRFGSVTNDVVDDHRHGIDPDRVVATEGLCDEQLGADPVGSGDEYWVFEIREPRREGAGKTTDASEDLRTDRSFRVLLYQRDCVVACFDIDA